MVEVVEVVEVGLGEVVTSQPSWFTVATVRFGIL